MSKRLAKSIFNNNYIINKITTTAINPINVGIKSTASYINPSTVSIKRLSHQNFLVDYYQDILPVTTRYLDARKKFEEYEYNRKKSKKY